MVTTFANFTTALRVQYLP